MSIAGGIDRSVERAHTVGATALQVFTRSSRQWSAKPLAAEEARRFRARAGAADLARHSLAHASYLVNLATPDRGLRRRSLAAMRDELSRCAALEIPFLVVHPGSHLGAGEERGMARVVRALDRLLGDDSEVRVLLEVTAGQGSNLGYRFEQLGWMLSRARHPRRLGVCFDTCHALAAGYEFRDARSYRETFREFDRVVGLEHLCAFHLNDSKHPLGSRKDRHEHIGDGEVGLEAFRLILNDRRFRRLPMVLETPKGADLAEDRRNLEVLRAMLPGARR